MPSCERCWEQSYIVARETGENQSDVYRRLVLTNDCTPEQQAGPCAAVCQRCNATTVHQHTRECTACGWKEGE